MQIHSQNDAALIEQKVSSRLIFDGKVVHLYIDEARLPDGKPATREVVRHVGAVCVVPLTEDGEVICVRQYRYPVGKVLLEIPAGKLDSKAEDHEQAARRELREETGVVCSELTHLGELYTTPGFSDENITMYLAQGLSYGKTDFDEDEFIDIVRIPLDELCDAIMRGEVVDSKTQVAVMKVWMLKNRKQETC